MRPDAPVQRSLKVSRAAFLKACGLVLVGARVDASALLDSCVQPSSTTESDGTGGLFTLHSANAERFRQQLNTSFTVRAADGASVDLVLAKVSERPITRNVEQFSLIFHAPAGTTVSHGTYGFQHRALGAFELFIVPIGAPDDRRTVYQACFSRHLSRAEVGHGTAAAASPRRRT
jgi:hypothetical protein